MFIINGYWYKIFQTPFEQTLSLSETINFYENVSYNNQFGSLKDAVISFYTSIETSASLQPEYQGLGTEQDPYLIYSESQFQAIPDKTISYYRLMNDLDFTGIALSPKRFYGTFDGQNYSIKNVNISNWTQFLPTTTRYAGLFAQVTGSGTRGIIRNIVLDNANYWVSGAADSSAHFGGIVGYMSSGKIINCHIKSSSFKSTGNSYSENFGGIVGYFDGSTFDSCSVVNSIFSCSKNTGTNSNRAGIIAGNFGALTTINKTFVQSCSIDVRRNNYPDPNGPAFRGGITQNYADNCYVKDVLVTSNVSASYQAVLSGIYDVGSYFRTSYAVITSSISGDTGKENVATFAPISRYYDNAYTSSLYNYEYAGIITGSGYAATTAQMLDPATYTARTSSWDFINIWTTGSLNGGYPYLRDNPPPF